MCLADIYDNVRDPVGEYVDLLARRHYLSVVAAENLMKVARDVRRVGGSKAAACEAAWRVVGSLKGWCREYGKSGRIRFN